MSENKDKKDEIENKEVEKQEEKVTVENVENQKKEEKNQEVTNETVMENSKETSEKKESIPETEAPKSEPVHVATVTSKPKTKKKVPWMPILKVCGVAVLSIGCGFGGGYFAGKQAAQTEITNAQSQLQSTMDNGMMHGGQDFQNMPNMDNNNSDSTSTTGAALGIYIETTTDNQVVVSGFADNSTAESAGLAEGDIITALDGTKVSTYDDIAAFLATKSAGDKVKVTVTRNSQSVDVTITLVEKSSVSSSNSNSTNNGNNEMFGNGMPSMDKTDGKSGATASPDASQQPQSSESSLQG